MCVIAVVAVAPCQWFSPGGHQTTSPGRISFFGPPWLSPATPAVTINVSQRMVIPSCTSTGLKRNTDAQHARRIGAWKSGSMRTLPVKYSSGPLLEGCEPLLFSLHFSIPTPWLTARIHYLMNLPSFLNYLLLLYLWLTE